jgi:hypothetical protein
MKKILILLLLFVSLLTYGQIDSTIFFPNWKTDQEKMLNKTINQEFYQDIYYLCFNVNVDKYDFLVICCFNDSLQSINFINTKFIQDDIVDLIYKDIRNQLYVIYSEPVETNQKYTKWITGDIEVVLYPINNAKIKRNQIEIRRI